MAVPDTSRFDVYLLAGQSNMAGRGVVTEQDKQPVPGILVLGKEDEWAFQGEPLHFDKPIAGVGLGFSFAKQMVASRPSVTIGLVPCAVGGTSMDEWQPGGELYENAIRRAGVATREGALKGILWHQGEAECGGEEKASAYAERLAKLVGDFRRDLNLPRLPFVAGEVGHFLYGKPNAAFAEVVNAQVRSFPNRSPYCATVKSDGLKDNGDLLHFDADSLKEFGLRYHEALIELQNTITEK